LKSRFEPSKVHLVTVENKSNLEQDINVRCPQMWNRRLSRKEAWVQASDDDNVPDAGPER
jgi:hypothetical protein